MTPTETAPAEPTGSDPSHTVDPADLGVFASRLVRLIRRDLELPAGTRVLSILDEQGPTGITVLARTDGCSQPTMSAQVAALSEAGLVSKSPNPDDARGSVIALTDAGRTELAATRQRIGGALRQRLIDSGHTEDELRITVELLRDLIAQG